MKRLWITWHVFSKDECDKMKATVKKDIVIILGVSFIAAAFYLALEGTLMEYGRDRRHPLMLRFLPVLAIQAGMSCLGPAIVFFKNKEKLREYGLRKKNLFFSLAGCLFAAVPTVIFLWMTDSIHGFLPFQGMFLTKNILSASFPFNVLGYLIVAAVWGFGEGFFYVILADKINVLRKPRGIWNAGALTCAAIAIAMHGMIGLDGEILAEALATFILMYGSLLVREKTGNAWGNIAIFLVIWNAL